MALVVLAILVFVWYLYAEAATAAAWKDPGYKYYANAISDLGVRGPGHTDRFLWTQPRKVYSPKCNLVNAAFASVGIAYVSGVGYLLQTRPSVLTHLVGVGLILLGIFDGRYPGHATPRLVMHWIAGGLAMGVGSLNTIVLSCELDFMPGQVIGIVGLVCGVIAGSCYRLGISAVPQRICVYGIFVGTIMIAIHCL
jgi:hypothetical membrane protein